MVSGAVGGGRSSISRRFLMFNVYNLYNLDLVFYPYKAVYFIGDCKNSF